MNSLELIIKDIDKSLDNDCLFAALALALTIPDICGKISCLGKDVGERYIRWFNKFIGEYEKYPDDRSNGIPYMNGELCYALRCSFLHSGDADVNKKHLGFALDNFVFIMEPKNPLEIYCESASIDCTFKGKTVSNYEVNVRGLCLTLKRAAESFLREIKDKSVVLPNIRIFRDGNEI